MRVCGVMSGTSLDGIDVAIVDLHGKRVQPVAFRSAPYPAEVRAGLLAVSGGPAAEISRMNFLLGELYAEAIRQACRRCRVPLKSVDLCGLHGQTIFHEGQPVEYLGRRIASTLQIGEAAVVAERTGIRTISNFRERDIAAGGQGAPLVPYVDYLLFRDRRIGRVALNIGGIANLTAIPAGASHEDVVAFDTGPGNMVIDALVAHMTKGRELFDRGGRIARRSKLRPELLNALLEDRFFHERAPKTTGRDQFGQKFTTRLIASAAPLEDLIATATELTVRTISMAVRDSTRTRQGWQDIVVSGGGVHNEWLMRRLRESLPEFKIMTSAEFGIDPDAKEAIAFAVLAYEAIRRKPASLSSATGARKPVLLGKSTPA
jgi:anhydro-N-acetylmuramic acid kinase